MIRQLTDATVRAELVEAPYFFSFARQKGPHFDKLSANGREAACD